MDEPRLFLELTRHNFFVAPAARFFLILLPASAGEAARLSDVLISRARLLWARFTRRLARPCGEPSAATEDAARRDERAIVVRYMAKGQGEEGNVSLVKCGGLGLCNEQGSQSQILCSVPARKRSRRGVEEGKTGEGRRARASRYLGGSAGTAKIPRSLLYYCDYTLPFVTRSARR